MKTNKKGFTLIELLAVIVILAIIALITVPVVIKIIDNAKKGAAEDSTYGVLTAAKLYWTTNQSSLDVANTDITFECNTKGVCSADVQVASTGTDGTITTTTKKVELDLEGTKPSDGTIQIVAIADQDIQYIITGLKYGDYVCNKGANETKVKCEAASSSSSNTSNTH